MTEKKQSRDMGIGPSTKKLKSMLKILSEHGVARDKDSEFEIELVVGFESQVENPQEFKFGDYDTEAAEATEETRPADLEPRDGLGFTDADYLWRSAQS